MTEEEFDQLRPSAFAIAYRMLGSVSEAEDVVQEGFLRLHRARQGGERIESPGAYLSTVVSRLSLDHLRSARVRRETYVGEWLPEPLVASADDDPARRAEMADSLSLAFLVLLESLSAEEGDLQGLETLLAHDVVLHGDGGGKAPALARAVHGRARVARTLTAWNRAGARLAGISIRRVELNGQPGALFLDHEDRVFSAMVLDIADGQVQGVNSIVNPDKLRHLGPVADLSALLRGTRRGPG